MVAPFRIVLFSEENSPFGRNFLLEMCRHDKIQIVAMVTQPEGVSCDYYDGSVSLIREAAARGINEILRPENVNRAGADLAVLDADFFILANYQQILQPHIFRLPKRLTINFHPSPLPRYAGLRPFFWMSRLGETDTGVSAIEVDELIDGGRIIDQIPIALRGEEDELTIREILFAESLALLQRVIARLEYLDRREFRQQDLNQRSYFSAEDFANALAHNGR